MNNVIQFPERSHEQWLPLAATGTEGVAVEPFRIFAEHLPDLSAISEAARHEALAILDIHRQNLRDGNFESVPLDVDAMSTAARVAQVRETHGEGSLQHQEARVGLVLDCGRKWAEAFRKNSWEFFPTTVQTHDADTNHLYAHGFSVDDMMHNGLSPLAEAEETELRVNDYAHLHVNKAILGSPVSHDIAALRLSPCPDWAIESYKTNPKAAHGGYAPEIQKLMINYDTFNPVEGAVFHEQFAVSGTFITTEVMAAALQTLEAIDQDAVLSKTEIHGTTGIVPKEVVSNVVDVLRLLDQIATELHGVNVFLGEAVPVNFVKAYNRVYAESEARRQQQAQLAEELADYIEGLHEQDIDHALGTVLVERYIQRVLLDVARQEPGQAEIIFNQETADGFREVQHLESLGLIDQAKQRLETVEQQAPAASSCGAGSCGLEGVDKESKLGRELAELTQAEDGDEIVRDKERACKCGKKEIVYAYNKTKVNKKCLGCGAFESKKTSPKAA
jgi:hypothetical protein